jgi:integrase/recombinase XerD
MSSEIVRVVTSVPEEARQQGQTDERIIDLWVHGRSVGTIRAYRADVARFRRAVRKSLAEVTLADIQSFADGLDATLAPATKHRCLSAVKSLYAFAHRIGVLRFDVARPLRLPVLRDRLSERILAEEEVRRMLARERHPRDHALLALLYVSAVRVSECCALKWRDLHERSGGAGQVTVMGKGGKTNAILIPASVWSKVVALRGEASEDDPVFRSRKGRHLHPTQARRIVRRAAKRAGIEKPVSPHWMRHASASHALDRGAPLHVVQQTLGHASVATTGRYLHVRPGESAGDYLDVE